MSGADIMAEMILKKMSVEKDKVQLHFTDIDFIADPWAWLYAMVLKKPKRDFFIDEMECPGKWQQAFGQAINKEYGRVATQEELAQLSTLFESMSTAYFAWKALGETEAEGRRTIRAVEEIAKKALTLFQGFDATVISNAVGKTTADEFLRTTKVAHLRLPKKSAMALASVMRIKAKEGEKVTTDTKAPTTTTVASVAVTPPGATPAAAASATPNAPSPVPPTASLGGACTTPLRRLSLTPAAASPHTVSQSPKSSKSPYGKKRNRMGKNQRDAMKQKAAAIKTKTQGARKSRE